MEGKPTIMRESISTQRFENRRHVENRCHTMPPQQRICKFHLGSSRVGLFRRIVPETMNPQCIGKRFRSLGNNRDNAGHISGATRCGIIDTGTHKDTFTNTTLS